MILLAPVILAEIETVGWVRYVCECEEMGPHVQLPIAFIGLNAERAQVPRPLQGNWVMCTEM